ncbi:unnamed protein product [Symbiodinium necroappetens]|uniref:Uncharacterized protein n=1 Tax=Symbiodinium necroappetens TaxID=1628268 RepID=A0A812ZVU8_9DINO|nr:unnamed protein product [Symbiodinium sp. CCMP2456]CAE7843391.1 unnamed protein product [Symbiodinium necroappetens]
MQVLLKGLIEENRALQKQLNSKGSSAAADPPKPKVADPATTRAAENSDPDGDEEHDDNDDEHEDDEEAEESDDADDQPSSTVTPPPKPSIEKPTPPAPEQEYKNANSSSHRAEWMSFSRRMESPDAATKFPEIMGLWGSSREDKLSVFREWLAKGKNYQDTECHMTFLREKKLKGKKEWECLTILEMVKRNFSTQGA